MKQNAKNVKGAQLQLKYSKTTFEGAQKGAF